MVNLTNLNAAVAAAQAQADKSVTTEAGAGVIIASIGAQITTAVTDALTADDAADNGSVQVATDAINQVVARYADSDASLGAAIANVPAKK